MDVEANVETVCTGLKILMIRGLGGKSTQATLQRTPYTYVELVLKPVAQELAQFPSRGLITKCR